MKTKIKINDDYILDRFEAIEKRMKVLEQRVDEYDEWRGKDKPTEFCEWKIKGDWPLVAAHGTGGGGASDTIPVLNWPIEHKPKEECICGGSSPETPHLKDCPLYQEECTCKEPKPSAWVNGEICSHCLLPIKEECEPHKAEHYLDNSIWCTKCEKWFYPKSIKEEPDKIREKIAKIINDKVDWAEWGQDDSRGYQLADKIISIIGK